MNVHDLEMAWNPVLSQPRTYKKKLYLYTIQRCHLIDGVMFCAKLKDLWRHCCSENYNPISNCHLTASTAMYKLYAWEFQRTPVVEMNTLHIRWSWSWTYPLNSILQLLEVPWLSSTEKRRITEAVHWVDNLRRLMSRSWACSISFVEACHQHCWLFF